MPTQLTFYLDNKPIRLHVQEPAGTTPQPALVLLHGASGHLDFWTSRLEPLLAEAGIALYAPHYFDAGAPAANTREGLLAAYGALAPQWIETVGQALRFVAGRPGVDPQRVVLAGISLGAFLSLGLAAERSASSDWGLHNRLRALIAVSGGLVEPYASRATGAFPPTLILHGAQDTVVPVSYAHALEQRLTALDVAHRTEILPTEGHWFSPAALPRLLLAVSGFLQAHLQPVGSERAM